MNQEEFEITIDKTGKVRLTTKGIKGKKCVEAAKVFEKIIGKILDTQFTSEYYEPETQVRIDATLENRRE